MSEEQEKIAALTAEVEALRKEREGSKNWVAHQAQLEEIHALKDRLSVYENAREREDGDEGFRRPQPRRALEGETGMKNDTMKPSVTVLIKIGSAMIHAEELIETKFKNADFDISAFNAVAQDPEVVAWVKAMGPMLPRKRSTR